MIVPRLSYPPCPLRVISFLSLLLPDRLLSVLTSCLLVSDECPLLAYSVEKLYEVLNSSDNAEDAANSLRDLIWDTQVKEKKKIKPDDRTALFFYMDVSRKRHETRIKLFSSNQG